MHRLFCNLQILSISIDAKGRCWRCSDQGSRNFQGTIRNFQVSDEVKIYSCSKVQSWISQWLCRVWVRSSEGAAHDDPESLTEKASNILKPKASNYFFNLALLLHFRHLDCWCTDSTRKLPDKKWQIKLFDFLCWIRRLCGIIVKVMLRYVTAMCSTRRHWWLLGTIVKW